MAIAIPAINPAIMVLFSAKYPRHPNVIIILKEIKTHQKIWICYGT